MTLLPVKQISARQTGEGISTLVPIHFLCQVVGISLVRSEAGNISVLTSNKGSESLERTYTTCEVSRLLEDIRTMILLMDCLHVVVAI